MNQITRRQCHAAFLGAAATRLAHAGQPPAAPARPRLAVSTWSFHNYFPNTRYGNPTFKVEDLRLEQVLRRAQQQLDIHAFELSSAHLASWEPKAVDQLKEFARENRIQFIHMSDNIRGVNMAHADPKMREEAMTTFERLIGVTQRLGIPTMRVNTGTPAANSKWDIDVTIASYRRLARFARERQVEIIIENHFGISADPANVVRIIEAVGENIGSCPDFGLFRDDDQRWTGMPQMLRHCRRIVSAKFHGLDDQNRHRDFDLERCYRLVREARFAGWCSLEYEGPLEPGEQLRRMAPLARKWLEI